ncbi:MAG: hypothetical protein CBB87_12230 [Micavibrio sp. TMED27]|nr:hypothetical protein [Micavibrio sp.]OUT89733.1 MAG: hypothetical protein CBB87_12230 [Micavibrio sp. TMED27]|tara:strand:+ start:279 stop:770 length:492 start_codon:yes stop_codon:yes gene_type:complete
MAAEAPKLSSGLKTVFMIAATAVLTAGITMGSEYIVGGLSHNTHPLAKETFASVIEFTEPVWGWIDSALDGGSPEDKLSGLTSLFKNVHEAFGITDTFQPPVLDVNSFTGQLMSSPTDAINTVQQGTSSVIQNTAPAVQQATPSVIPSLEGLGLPDLDNGVSY